ncbi:MAG: hypothetical protein Q8N74_04645 [Sulfuricella sp.]|nr:hypothetical protein [Sulfuricella sp.]
MDETTISCIADAYKQPLADLVVNVHQRQSVWAYIEKDYAIPLILLSVAMFESYMVRAAFLALPADQRLHIPATLEEQVVSGNLETGNKIFRRLYADYPMMVEIDEVYVLRDALTHNHLWEFERSDGVALRRILGGNASYKNNVDFDTLKTKSLELPIVPGHQDWFTASKCFRVLWDAWGYIETREPRHVVSRKGAFNVRIKPNCFPQFEGRNSVCLAELFAMPLAT